MGGRFGRHFALDDGHAMVHACGHRDGAPAGELLPPGLPFLVERVLPPERVNEADTPWTVRVLHTADPQLAPTRPARCREREEEEYRM